MLDFIEEYRGDHKAVAFIALGSNLNSPKTQVLQAIANLQNMPKTQLVKESNLYETKPELYEDQPDFVNAVVAVKTNLTAVEIFNFLLEQESKAGRVRTGILNRPRILDLDLLLYNDVVMYDTDHNLTLPHPRMHLRNFVLKPLSDLVSPQYLLDIKKFCYEAINSRG